MDRSGTGSFFGSFAGRKMCPFRSRPEGARPVYAPKGQFHFRPPSPRKAESPHGRSIRSRFT
jgi:hypothetical protein